MRTRTPILATFALLLQMVPSHAGIPTDITSLGTASQTHSHGSGLYPAENAVDGDLQTFNHTSSAEPGAAWELHFPSEQELSQIDITTRDCCAGRLNGATLRLFDAEAEMVFEIAIVDRGPLTTFSATIPEGTQARDIRIGFEDGQSGIVHLAEVNVFSPAGEPPVIDNFSAVGNTLSWVVSGADTVKLHSVGNVPASGSTTVSPAESSVYFLSATNACDTVTASATVMVGGAPLLPRITEFGAIPNDWIEIWNPGEAAIDLTGWHLSDDPNDLQRWQFPSGQSLGAGNHLVIDEPFGIAREADSYLALINPSGTIVSEFTYPEQLEGVSYGTDLDGEELYFLEPSPGEFNLGATTLGFLEGVDFSLPRGLYSEPFFLTLSPKTPGATVLYSTDGSDPTTEFVTPVQISTTTAVRAVEVLAGREPARSEAHSYLFLDDVAVQPEFPVGFPHDWLPSSASGALAPIPRRSDFEMDPEIVNDAPFSDRAGVDFDIPDALASLPSLCLTLPNEEMWDPDDGIHANALKRGRSWEREISMEIIDPQSGEHFHTNCGLRIHGGRGRVAEMLKKSFRLYFRGDYGATKMKFPLFENMPASGVDHLVLRGGNGKTWASPWRDLTGGGNSLPRVTYLRDQFLRDSNQAMGQASFAGTFVHLYINGIYWGLYNPVERPGAPYAANHFGGDADTDWDFLKWANGFPTQIVSGDTEAWDEVLNLSRSNPGANYAALEERVDIDNLADFLIANFYVGNRDWVGTRNNGYAFRSRTGILGGKFHFMCWDGEESLLSTGSNSTDANRETTTMELHLDLRTVAEYQLRFADRVHRHLVDEDGALRTPHATARHDALADLVDQGIAAESARWGDLLRPDDPYTFNGDWLSEIANITNNYLTSRASTTLSQLRSDKLYPDTVAPVAEIVGTNAFSLSAPAGTIWYTTDGSEPMNSPSAQIFDLGESSTTIFDLGSQWRFLDDGSDLSASNWTELAYDDTRWGSGGAPLGYGLISGTTIQTPVGFGGDINNRHITTYFRHTFQIADASALGALELRYFRDDGAVVYLNGTEINRSNMPAGAIDSSTTALISISGTAESTLFAAEVPAGLLLDGDNILAVEIHQNRNNSSDMGFDLRLVETSNGVRLDGDARIKTRALNGGEWSALEDETFRVSAPSQSLVISEIMYHPADPNAAEIAAGFTDDDFFEYIEIRNVGSGNLLLDGMRFNKGVDVELSGTLAPGAAALVVADRAAFELRHGNSLPVIAEWQAGDKLDNGGERIRLRSYNDTIIHDFAYDDQSPWPTSPDGVGNSLVLTAPSTLPDHAIAQNWRPSASTNGNPGTSDATTFPGGDAADLLTYATRGNLQTQILADGSRAFTIEFNPFADDVIGGIETSTDLRNWRDASDTIPRTSVAPASGEFAVATFTLEKLPTPSRLFVRYRINLR